MISREVHIDTRREFFRKSSPDFQLLNNVDLTNPIKNLPEIKGKDLVNADLITIQAGDGSIGYVLNQLLHEVRSMENNYPEERLPLILLLGGGTANTLLKGLIRSGQEDIPESLADVFPEGSFEIRSYSPPQVVNEEKGITYLAYLASFGHLGISSTKTKEDLAKRFPEATAKYITMAYVLSGVRSFLSLNSKSQPEDVVFVEDGVEKQVQGEIAAAEAIAVPVYGTFSSKDPIDSNKVRLITLTAENKRKLAIKYLLALLIGGTFPNGLDKLRELKIINTRDTFQTSVVLDPRINPNANLDGEQRLFNGKCTVSRSPLTIDFVIPKELINI